MIILDSLNIYPENNNIKNPLEDICTEHEGEGVRFTIWIQKEREIGRTCKWVMGAISVKYRVREREKKQKGWEKYDWLKREWTGEKHIYE